MLSKGANINATNRYGRTPLHIAAAYKKQVNYNILANYDNVNTKIKDKDGKTADDIFMDFDIHEKVEGEITEKERLENMRKERLDEYLNKN